MNKEFELISEEEFNQLIIDELSKGVEIEFIDLDEQTIYMVAKILGNKKDA